ncbi:MAG TPA: DUF58 domain-containing protein [Solirubrobacteraceae bacterium]|nr:DUF58 domain-containing protein [Solirubrobacteraceae bacterium]
MSPTLRAATTLGAIALSALVLPLGLVAIAAVVLLAATAFDAWVVRKPPELARTLPQVLSRGARVPVRIEARAPGARALRLRQATPAALALDPSEGGATLESALVPRTRGRHALPPVGVRAEGPLGLGAAYSQVGGTEQLLVYPDLVGARRLARAAREGRLLDSRTRARGPLGLGTDFESVREWAPDDDVRHINWAATQRIGRPMTNQYRLDQARELVFMIDAGRLMAAPLGDRTRLDAALDAVTAVALTADELSDHCGAVAFDSEVRLQMRPRRAGGRDVVRALFDLQPRLVESDYEQAFRRVAGGRRALILILCDLFDDAAARALIEAAAVLARRHAVLAATVTDPDLERLVHTAPAVEADVYAAAVALDLLDARGRATARLRRSGVRVVESAPESFPAACVQAYLTAKARLRL